MTDTVRRLDEFSAIVEETLENAATNALKTLQNQLQEQVSALVRTEYDLPRYSDHVSTQEAPILRHRSSSQGCLNGTHSSHKGQQTGRSRERFTRLQEQLVVKARSILSERELTKVSHQGS